MVQAVRFCVNCFLCLVFETTIFSEWRDANLRLRGNDRPPISLEVFHGPQQLNDYNCGAYALLWATKWVRHESSPDDFSSVRTVLISKGGTMIDLWQFHITRFRADVADAMQKYVNPDREAQDKAREKREAAARKLKGYSLFCSTDNRIISAEFVEPREYNLESDTSDEGDNVVRVEDLEPAPQAKSKPLKKTSARSPFLIKGFLRGFSSCRHGKSSQAE